MGAVDDRRASETVERPPAPVRGQDVPFRLAYGQANLGRQAERAEGSVLDSQLRQAIGNLAALLESAGASLSDVVKTTVFLVDMDDYAVMNDVYCDGFGDHRPARSAVAVAALPLGAVVELEAWSHVPA